MQTFLPYPDSRESARALDPKRLGNQFYREGLTLLRGRWRHHPASKMWSGYESALCAYLLACALELQDRGYHYPHHVAEVQRALRGECPDSAPRPYWLGDQDFHARHRAALLYKYPEWYERFGWREKPGIDYIWPKAS